MKYLKTYFRFYLYPVESMSEFIKFKISFKTILLILLFLSILSVELNFIYFVITSSQITIPETLFEKTSIHYNSFLKESINIFIKGIWEFMKICFMSWIFFKILSLFRIKTNFYKILLWGMLGLSFSCLLHIFDIWMLYGREFVPILKPYTIYIYVVGVLYYFYLKITSFGVVSKLSFFKSLFIVLFFNFMPIIFTSILTIMLILLRVFVA